MGDVVCEMRSMDWQWEFLLDSTEESSKLWPDVAIKEALRWPPYNWAWYWPQASPSFVHTETELRRCTTDPRGPKEPQGKDVH